MRSASMLGAVIICGMEMGCTHRSPSAVASTRSSAADYFPLAVGNRWTYRARHLGEDRTQEVEILKEEGGYFIDNQGGELTIDALGIHDRKRYLLREPLEVGTQWTNVLSVSSVEHYRLVGLASCEVPAGRFENCVRVEGKNRVDDRTTLVNELLFAPGTGIVQVEVAAEVNGKRIPQTRLVLTRFEPAGSLSHP